MRIFYIKTALISDEKIKVKTKMLKAIARLKLEEQKKMNADLDCARKRCRQGGFKSKIRNLSTLDTGATRHCHKNSHQYVEKSI